MNVALAIQLLQAVMTNLPGAITTVEQLSALGQSFMNTVNGTAPTADEITALEAAIDTDLVDALTPLPPAQPGDPDYVEPPKPATPAP